MKNFISSAIKSLTPVEIERLAIKSGFQKRVPRKITSMELLNLYCLESIDKAPSFNDVAGILNDLAGKHPSRQAVGKRINKEFSDFLKMILEHTINYKIMGKSNIESRTECFPRIIVQDSTIVKLPIRLFAEFSGVSNSHSSVCNARIQGAYDLVAKSFVYFSIDKYSKNDMDAADNLSIQYGDLILRDRGYLKSNEIKRFSSMHTFYIYRHANSMIYRFPKNDEEINLPELLTKEVKIDMNVCLNNKERTVVRLVAAPVSEKTANLRRMKSKRQDSGHNPSKKKLFLMSWTIFITNLPVSKYDFKMILDLYSLRWRIEIIFKTWKSNMFGKIYKKKDRETHSYKEKILTALEQLFIKYGTKCTRKDATWGSSQTGNALLDCGSKGEQILEDLKNTASDPIIRDNAFKILYLRTHPGYFLKVTEEKDDELFSNRPIHKDQDILFISFENKSFLKPSRGYVGKLYQKEGKCGIFKKTGPFIEKNKEYTGSTSLKIAPKNNFFGWTSKGVGINQDFSFSFDLYRTKNGAFNLFLYERIILGGRAFKGACAGIHIKADGTIFLRNIKNNKWISTKLIIPHESKIRLIVDGDKEEGIYRVSIKKGNGEIIQSSINASLPKGSLLNMYELFSISKEGKNVYIDNIKLIQKKDKLKAKPVLKKKDESSVKNIIRKIDNPEIIRCSFEEKNIFHKNITGIAGTQKLLFGRWGNFSKDGPLIVGNQKHNGKQCVKLIRGGKQLVASTQKALKINADYVLTLWIKRMDSAFLVYICNMDKEKNAGIFVAADGSVRLRNFKKHPVWKPTKLKVPSGKWVKLQIISEMKESRYRVAVFNNGKREISTISSKMNIKGKINTVAINAQAAMGSVTYIDDISLLNIFDSD